MGQICLCHMQVTVFENQYKKSRIIYTYKCQLFVYIFEIGQLFVDIFKIVQLFVYIFEIVQLFVDIFQMFQLFVYIFKNISAVC